MRQIHVRAFPGGRFYKSEFTLAYATSGFCAYVLFQDESYALFYK